MGAGEWVALALLVALVAAVVFGRRRGKSQFAAAMAKSYAQGHADATAVAEARAAAVATGGAVHLHGLGAGLGQPGAGADDDYHHLDPATVAYLGRVLRGLDTVRGPAIVDDAGMGSVLDRVQRGSAEAVRDGDPVRALVRGGGWEPGRPAAEVTEA